MPVDEKRVQLIVQSVVEAADPAHQARILERECASDPELRKRVESLLRTHREMPTILGVPPAPGTHVSTSSSAHTIAVGPVSDAERALVSTSRPDRATDENGAKEDEEPIALEFLAPSSKPGSLGRLGHHEVLEVLGKGGFGIVVRAFDETLHRVVAIKVLLPALAATSPARKRFLREARASARVRHENVVHIYAVEEQPLPYLVMEYIPGQTLQQRLDQNGPLDVADTLRIGAQIARGLASAHEQGLIHRDIKPANILLEDGLDQKVKISDFGLARAADDASLSQSGVIAGTPMFMAPEQAKGEPPDPRADLFSLGSVLYTMVSGRPPFRAANTMAVLKRVAEDTPRPIRQIIPEVPQWLCDIIATLHAKEPSQRFQSAVEVAGLLEQHQAHLQQPSLVPRPERVKPPGRRRLSRTAVLAAAGALAILSAVVAYAFWPHAAPVSKDSGPAAPGQAGERSQTATTKPADQLVAGVLHRHLLQGGADVYDALIDFAEPTRRFGEVAQDNALRRADRQCDAFLVRFDLTKLKLPPKARVESATLSFYVWDPSSHGKTRVSVFPLKTAWDESTVTWNAPQQGKTWKGGASFDLAADASPAGAGVVVLPEEGSDTVDPPTEYQFDVTDLVKSWLDGRAPNLGLAIAPVIDPSVDAGVLSRFQIFSSEHSHVNQTPKLTLQVRE
jgi:serine/threonine protein kinase